MNKSKKLSLNEKLDLILKNEEIIIKNEKKILQEEQKLEEMEQEDLDNDQTNIETEEQALKALEKLERNLRESKSSAIRKITKRDLVKGSIGSFIGVMSHFAFTKGADLAYTLELWRVTMLYIVAFIIIVGLLYYTGFRKVEKQVVLKFMPARAIILYAVSVLTIFFVNLLFGKIHFPLDIIETYKIVGTSIILGVMGAGTADLIGREE